MATSGQPDLLFSMGLDANGLVLSLQQSEPQIKGALDKIVKAFTEATAKINAGSNASPFAKLLGELKSRADYLNLTLKDTLRLINAVKTASAGKQTFSVDTTKSYKDIVALQKQIAQLRNQIISIPARIPTAGGGGRRPASSSALDDIRFRQETFNQVFQRSAGILRNVSTVLSTIGVGGGIFALIYGFKQLVSSGIEFNAELEQAKISLGAIIAANAEKITQNGLEVTGLAAIMAVQGNINGLIKELRLDALVVRGTFADLLGIAESITPAVLRMGGNMEKVRNLTRATGIAASVLNLSFKDATNGILQLLNGTILRRNELVKRLPVGSIDELKKGLADAGGRADYLLTLMNKFAAAAPLLQVGYKAVSESVKDIIQQLSGVVTAPLKTRIQELYNFIVQSSLKFNKDGAPQLTGALKESADQASLIVERLITQVTVLGTQLLAPTGGRTFLQALGDNLPGIVEAIFGLLNVVKQISSFMIDHGQTVLTLIKYYVGFRVVQGIFGSLLGIVRNLGGEVTNLGKLAAAMFSMATGATSASAAVTGLGIAWKSLAVGTVVLGVLVALVEIGRSLYDRKKQAEDFKASLNDINNLNFDAAIYQLQKLSKAFKSGSDFFEFKRDATKRAEILSDYATTVAAIESKFLEVAAKAGVGVPVASADTAGQVLRSARQGEIATQDQFAKGGIKREDAEKKIAELRAAKRAASDLLTVYRDTAGFVQQVYDMQEDLTGKVGQQVSRAGSEGAKAEAARIGAELEESAQVTSKKVANVTDAAAKQQDGQREAAINAIRQAANAQLQIEDKVLQTRLEQIQQFVKERTSTEQQAAAAELSATKITAANKLAILRTEFEDIIEISRGGAADFRKDFGFANFDELLMLKDGDLEERVKNFQLKNQNEKDPNQISRNKRDLSEAVKAMEIYKGVRAAQEQVAKKTADSVGDIAEANRKAESFIREANASIRERLAILELEREQTQDLSDNLEDRLAREERITDLIVKRNRVSADKDLEKVIQGIDGNTTTGAAEKAFLTSAAIAENERRKAQDAEGQKLELVRRQHQIREAAIRLDEEATTLKESELQTFRNLYGAELDEYRLRQDALLTEKALHAEKKAMNALATAEALRTRGQASEAAELEAQAKVFNAQAAEFRSEKSKYLQDIGNTLERMGATFERINSGFGRFLLSLGSMAKTFGGLSDIGALNAKNGGRGGVLGGIANLFASGDRQFGSLFKGSSGESVATGALGLVNKISGKVGGFLKAAGPFGEIASTALGLFTGMVDIFSAGAKKVIQAASDKFKEANAEIVDNLRRGRSGLGETISDLEGQRGSVGAQIPQAKVSGWMNFLTFGFAQKSANSARDEAIKENLKALDDQIKQLKKDAEDLVRVLETVTLPQLRVGPESRAFFDQLQQIKDEITRLTETPGVSRESLNELFNLRLLDLQKSAGDTLLEQKSKYLDYLKQQKDLQQSLVDLNTREQEANAEYARQRNEILGVSTRQQSRSEKLKELDEAHKRDLAQMAAQRQELTDRLSLATKEVALYQDKFGIVKDIREYEIAIQDELLGKEEARLTALLAYWGQLKELLGSSLEGFLPGAMLPPSMSAPVNTATNSGSSTNFTVSVGEINIGGTDLSTSQIRDAVTEGLRSIREFNTVKGIAFANG